MTCPACLWPLALIVLAAAVILSTQ